MKWIYRSEWITTDKALNSMGAEGWELVAVDFTEREGIGFCVFKMPQGKLKKTVERCESEWRSIE